MHIVWLCLGLLLHSCSKDPVMDNTPPNKEDPNSEKPMEPDYLAGSHPIGISIQGGEAVFVDERSGDVFTPRGTNYFKLVNTPGGFQDRIFHPNHFNLSDLRAVFRKLIGHGYNTVRIFFDTCNDDPGCIGKVLGTGLNQNYVKNIAAIMQLAKDEGIFLILTSNDLPSQGGYWELSNRGATDMIDGYRNAHYLTAEGVASAVNYWKDIMQALYKEKAEFSHVLGWSILNEHWYFGNAPPFNLTTGSIVCANGKTYALSSAEEKGLMAEESIVYYIDQVVDVIREFDVDGLVTMGVFAPNTPNVWRPGDFKYVETSEIVNNSKLDFLDLHIYPATSTLAKLFENFKVVDAEKKPIIMGEVGAFLSDYTTVEFAGLALKEWIARSCDFGFDGWLTWGMERAPSIIGDATWSLLDSDEYLLNELAPNMQPNACSNIWLGDENLALDKSATASNFLPGEFPEFAIDGDRRTQWGAGEGAPQWIEIDLGNSFVITRIRMFVAQFPEGNTVHKILVAHTQDDFSELTNLSNYTRDGDHLEWTGKTSNVRYVRIETSSSPSWVSWKEVEVY